MPCDFVVTEEKKVWLVDIMFCSLRFNESIDMNRKNLLYCLSAYFDNDFWAKLQILHLQKQRRDANNLFLTQTKKKYVFKQ